MEYKLFYFLLGCKPKGRHIEQHDVFFAIGQKVSDLIPALKNFWPDGERLHIDCWREITNVQGYSIKTVPKNTVVENNTGLSLFFINLGGYKKGEFNEFHAFELVAANSQKEAIKISKQTSFFKQYHFPGAKSHIDDKYGVDVDEIYPVDEILSKTDKMNYRIVVTNELTESFDELHLGYTTLSKLASYY